MESISEYQNEPQVVFEYQNKPKDIENERIKFVHNIRIYILFLIYHYPFCKECHRNFWIFNNSK